MLPSITILQIKISYQYCHTFLRIEQLNFLACEYRRKINAKNPRILTDKGILPIYHTSH